MLPANRGTNALTVSRLFGGLAVLSAAMAAVALLFPQPLVDVFFAAWVLFAVVLASVGAFGAWTRRTVLVWVAALLLAGVAVVGMWSIGLFIAPAAIALLGSAVASHWTSPRPGTHESVLDDPPSVVGVVCKTLAGAALVVVGAALAYEGTLVRELFTGGCASETLDCALAVTRWDAVGISLLGLAATGFGGRLIWKQVTVGWVLGSNYLG